MILGFGSTEENVRREVKEALLSAMANKQNTDDVLKPWNDKADEYDKLSQDQAPERYSRIWFYGNKLIFHHINRRHAFSPDGWALLKIEEEL